MSGRVTDYDNVSLTGNIDTDIKTFKEIFSRDDILRIRNIGVGDISCALLFMDGMVNTEILGEMIEQENRETTKDLLANIDYIVDGRFVEELKDPKLRFRGSRNQRIIDVKKSLDQKEIVLWDGIDKDLG